MESQILSQERGKEMEEKLFLVCSACGEVFDTLETAKAHESECEEFLPDEACSYLIRTESEAF